MFFKASTFIPHLGVGAKMPEIYADAEKTIFWCPISTMFCMFSLKRLLNKMHEARSPSSPYVLPICLLTYITPVEVSVLFVKDQLITSEKHGNLATTDDLHVDNPNSMLEVSLEVTQKASSGDLAEDFVYS